MGGSHIRSLFGSKKESLDTKNIAHWTPNFRAMVSKDNSIRPMDAWFEASRILTLKSKEMNFQILVKHQKSAILLTTWQSLKVITVYINIRSIMLGATLELYSRILGLELYLTSEDVLELRIDICQMFKLFLFVYFSISVFNISSVVQHKPISESISLRWMHKTQRNNAVFDFQSEILSPVDFMLPNLSSSFFLNFEWSWFEFRFFFGSAANDSEQDFVIRV